MLILFLILIALCSYGAWEYVGHQRRLKRIPLRIHVNGSRGKSSVTRLIAAGLRAGGIRTVGKTTGTLPCILDPNGNDIAIDRPQRANINEQIKMLRYIDKYKPEALVTECMAVLPEYQWICEKQMVRSTVGVITNCRLDHTNEMGKFREQISLSLANTCPRNGVLFTSEKKCLNVLKKVATREHTDIRQVDGKDVSIDELRRFGYIEHTANVGLSLAVCERAGVDRETALEGMYKSIPDAGALTVAVCSEGDIELLFVNALAANDPESTLEIWHLIRERFSPLGKVIILLNSRADRQDRSVQLIEMVAKNIEFDYFVLTGEKTKKFMGDLFHNNVPKEKSIPIGIVQPEKTYHRLFELVDVKGTILAIGNVGAGGLDLFHYFDRQKIFPIGLSCPHCNRSLMDPSYLIDSFPSIHVIVEMGNKRGWFRLSTMFGSYKTGSAFDIPHDTILRMFCMHCETELVSNKKCPDCGINMISMAAPNGGTAYICPRYGCKGHILETVNQET